MKSMFVGRSAVVVLLGLMAFSAFGFPPYASKIYVPGVSDTATGFFHVKEMPDGKSWVIDPLGRGTVIFGIDHVRYNGHWTSRVKPPRAHYLEHNKKAYPNRAAWEEETLARLTSWGFNLLGAGSDESLERRGLAHARNLALGSRVCSEKFAPDWHICPNEHRPCSALPNVFHPEFEKWCDSEAARLCAPSRDDPWLFGYFIDNELAWWGRGDRQTGLWESVLALPEGHSARQAIAAYAAAQGIADLAKATRAEKTGFVRLAAEKYFSITTAAVRRHDPNHLVLGSRFPGVHGAPDVVWETAGRFCDVITLNSYPFVDLDRGVVHNSRGERHKTIGESYACVQARVRRPLLITEWSFPALDSGLPCTHGAGQRFYTQAERAEATRLYAQTILALPFMVGYDYFMWVDQPPEGISDAFPEDSNYGLVSEKGVPYPEIVAALSGLQNDIGTARSRPVPPPKPRTKLGTGWKGPSLAQWQVNGRDVGEFRLMLSYKLRGKNYWTPCASIASCLKAKTADGEVWTLVGAGEHAKDVRFEITHTLDFDRSRPDRFRATVTGLRNTGTVPLKDVRVYFCAFAPYAFEESEGASTDTQNIWARKSKDVPNLWKGPKEGRWLARDGRYIGVKSLTSAEGAVKYFVDAKQRTQHPDAWLMPADEPLDLKPGEAHVSDGRLYFDVFGGTDGEAGWMRASSFNE